VWWFQVGREMWCGRGGLQHWCISIDDFICRFFFFIFDFPFWWWFSWCWPRSRCQPEGLRLFQLRLRNISIDWLISRRCLDWFSSRCSHFDWCRDDWCSLHDWLWFFFFADYLGRAVGAIFKYRFPSFFLPFRLWFSSSRQGRGRRVDVASLSIFFLIFFSLIFCCQLSFRWFLSMPGPHDDVDWRRSLRNFSMPSSDYWCSLRQAKIISLWASLLHRRFSDVGRCVKCGVFRFICLGKYFSAVDTRGFFRLIDIDFRFSSRFLDFHISLSREFHFISFDAASFSDDFVFCRRFFRCDFRVSDWWGPFAWCGRRGFSSWRFKIDTIFRPLMLLASPMPADWFLQSFHFVGFSSFRLFSARFFSHVAFIFSQLIRLIDFRRLMWSFRFDFDFSVRGFRSWPLISSLRRVCSVRCGAEGRVVYRRYRFLRKISRLIDFLLLSARRCVWFLPLP